MDGLQNTNEATYDYKDQETEYCCMENISHGAIKLIDEIGIFYNFH